MGARSAGLLIWRRGSAGLEVLLVHPGGPYWRHKDAGAWSIPKGEIDPGEEPLVAAVREVEEEIGYRATGPFEPLDPVRQKAGKEVLAWAVEGDLDTKAVISNTFDMEWPPRSGSSQAFPEIDRAEFFPLAEVQRRINPAQRDLLEQLQHRRE